MKQILILFLCAFLGACSSMIPYKDQDLNYLHGIEQNPQNYMDKVVSFGGEVQGVTEDTNLLRLVLKIDVPLYYYAIGKDTLSYELLLVTYEKKDLPQMTGIKKRPFGKSIGARSQLRNTKKFSRQRGGRTAFESLCSFQPG